MTTTDVLIVGGGICGAASALALVDRGARVAVVEAGLPGGASAAAAGMLAPGSEAHQDGAFRDLCLASLAAWPALAERIREEGEDGCRLVLDGVLRVAATEKAADDLRAVAADQRSGGMDVRWCDADQAAELEPAAAPTHGAAWYGGEGHVDSPRARDGLLAAAQRRGAQLVRARVLRVDPRGRLCLDDGTVWSASTVVLAAGSWSGHLSTVLGLGRLAVRPIRGQLIELRDVHPFPSRVIYGGRVGYAVPKAGGRLLVGATEENVGFDVTTTASATDLLLSTAAQLVSGATASHLHSAWAGLRPATQDRLPILGEVEPRCGGRLIVATAHHRNGVLLAPQTGDAVAHLVVDGGVPPLWADFSPNRLTAAAAARGH